MARKSIAVELEPVRVEMYELEILEVNGADAALSFIKGKGLSDRRAQLIWDLVALNSTPSLALPKEPEVAIGTMGIGLDYGGFGRDALDAGDIAQILTAVDVLMNAPLQRYPDEFVRHKILDAVGDLKLAGLPMIARFEGRKSSHALNNQLLRALFADPARVQDDWYDAAVDDFLRTWRAPRARTAFAAALRNVYLDEPLGDGGFWTRLARMQPPALYVYGARDVLITHRFGGRVLRTLPAARVEVWDEVGHVPHFEVPERTHAAILAFIDEVETSRA